MQCEHRVQGLHDLLPNKKLEDYRSLTNNSGITADTVLFEL